MNEMLAELVKSLDNLQKMEFDFEGKEFCFYYKYLTLLEKVRVEQFSVRPHTIYNEDGSKTTKYEKDNNLYPVHLIIEKALDKDGNKIFSHTNKKDIETVSKLPFELASMIAYHFTADIFNSMEKQKEEENKG